MLNKKLSLFDTQFFIRKPIFVNLTSNNLCLHQHKLLAMLGWIFGIIFSRKLFLFR